MLTRRAPRPLAVRPLVVTAGALLALTTACGGSDEAATAAGSSSATATSSSSAAPSSASSSAAPSSAAPSSAPGSAAPGGSVGAATPAPGAPGAPGTAGGGDTGSGAAVPGTTGLPQVAEVDPAKGQAFLDSLHANGIPQTPGDAFIGQYAPIICQSLAEGASPEQVRSQVGGVGDLFSSISTLTPDQVRGIFVTSAQQTYC